MLRSGQVPEFTSIRALVVDDNDYILKLLRVMLSEMGVSYIATARDAVEAMKALSNPGERINLIICDWNMPGITGLEFLRKIRSDRPQMPFLMVTGRNDEESVVQAKGAGVSAYLVKPFSPQLLAKTLKVMFKQPA
jgi:two-component system chemotaxis response regulator CheY